MPVSNIEQGRRFHLKGFRQKKTNPPDGARDAHWNHSPLSTKNSHQNSSHLEVKKTQLILLDKYVFQIKTETYIIKLNSFMKIYWKSEPKLFSINITQMLTIDFNCKLNWISLVQRWVLQWERGFQSNWQHLRPELLATRNNVWPLPP